MRSSILTLVLVAGLAACGEEATLTGPADSAAEPPSVAAADPIDDALARISPALGDGDLVAALRAELRRVRSGGNTASLAAGVEPHLRRLEDHDSALTADVDAIRLALTSR